MKKANYLLITDSSIPRLCNFGRITIVAALEVRSLISSAKTGGFFRVYLEFGEFLVQPLLVAVHAWTLPDKPAPKPQGLQYIGRYHPSRNIKLILNPIIAALNIPDQDLQGWELDNRLDGAVFGPRSIAPMAQKMAENVHIGLPLLSCRQLRQTEALRPNCGRLVRSIKLDKPEIYTMIPQLTGGTGSTVPEGMLHKSGLFVG
jgi:hypothetical protein